MLYNPNGDSIYISIASEMKLKAVLTLVLTSAVCLLAAGCASPPLKPSPGYVQAPPPVPAGEIPEPVRVAPILSKPKPAVRPETYSVVVNNVKVQELLFALARDAKLNVDVHSGARSPTVSAILSQIAAKHAVAHRISRIP